MPIHNGPHQSARMYFRAGFYGTLLVGGYLFSKLVSSNPFEHWAHSKIDDEFRHQAIMIEGPNKPVHNNYDEIYPAQRVKKQRATSFYNSNFCRAFFPAKADYSLRTEVKAKYIDPRNDFAAHSAR